MIIESILLNTMLSLQHVDQTSGIVPLYYFNFFSDLIFEQYSNRLWIDIKQSFSKFNFSDVKELLPCHN